jgi:hypothetical protein
MIGWEVIDMRSGLQVKRGVKPWVIISMKEGSVPWIVVLWRGGSI